MSNVRKERRVNGRANLRRRWKRISSYWWRLFSRASAAGDAGVGTDRQMSSQQEPSVSAFPSQWLSRATTLDRARLDPLFTASHLL